MDYNEAEREVLNHLGCESFSRVKKDDIIKVAAMMPELPPEHALRIIEQFLSSRGRLGNPRHS
ncbi:MAG: hypothetical protein B7C54_00200 [Acidimicrobiales bacterium mtb01]|nr:hypothetical protein [Actinomycetota bacterium]TEX48692.1 MAG: hypothetical protein B7C54_00200 [Acidimicrobiales bacterium mtb01]